MVIVVVMIKLMIVIIKIAMLIIMITMTIMIKTIMMVIMVIMTLIMITIKMIRMIKMIFQKTFFKKPLSVKNQSFSHLCTQILICLFCSLQNIVQDWCCQVIILPSYNVSKMFLGCLYYSIISGYNVTVMLRANEASVFFNQSYLKKEYT